MGDVYLRSNEKENKQKKQSGRDSAFLLLENFFTR